MIGWKREGCLGLIVLLVSVSSSFAAKPTPTPKPTASPSPSSSPVPTATVSATPAPSASATASGGNGGGKKISPTPAPSVAPTPIDGRTDWNGTTSSDANTAANWTPTGASPGSAPPVPGDVAWFSATPTNKIVNLSASLNLAGLYFTGTGASGYSLTATSPFTYTLTANGTTIGTEISNATAVAIGAENTSGTNTISAPIILAPASGTVSTIFQQTGGILDLAGGVTGTGSVSKTGGGNLTLSGATNSLAGISTTAGTTTVASGAQLAITGTGTFTISSGASSTINGTLLYQSSTSWASTALAGTLTIASGGTYIHNTTAGVTNLLGDTDFVLASGSNFIYRGSSTTNTAVSVSGRTYYNLAFESTSGTWNASSFSGSNAWTVNGDLSIGSGVGINFGTYTGATNYNGNVTVSGTLGLTNGARSFTIGSGKTLTVNSGGTLNMATGQNATIASGGTAIINGTVGITGTGGNILVNNGGTLRGSGGTINTGTNKITINGTVSPGTADGNTGILNLTSAFVGTGALTLSNTSTFVVDINGTTAGTGFDQLNLTGTLDVTGSTLSLNIGTTLALAQTFTIIANDGTLDAVTGQFAQGTSISSGAYTFGINYAGGDGNDVVLTVTAIPEASTWIGAALALGVIGYSVVRRRKARRA